MNKTLKLAKVDEDDDDVINAGPEYHEAQLVQLQINYKKLSDHYEAYKIDIAKKRCLEHEKVSQLEKECSLLTALLSSVNSPELRRRDNLITSDLETLLTGVKQGNEDVLTELENIRKDGLEIEEWEKRLTEQRKVVGSLHAMYHTRIKQQRHTRILENRLYKLTTDNMLTSNRALREEIAKYRSERAIFDRYYSKVVAAVEECKARKADILGASQIALENRPPEKGLLHKSKNALKIRQIQKFNNKLIEGMLVILLTLGLERDRQEALGKIRTLKYVDAKEQTLFENNMKIWSTTLHMDANVGEFMITKLNNRPDFKATEINRRDKATQAAYKSDMETLNKYAETYESMQEVTDQPKVMGMIENYVSQDSENFALFKYVSELNGEIQVLSEEVTSLQTDIEQMGEQEQEFREQHDAQIHALQEELDGLRIESGSAERELHEINEAVGELMSLVVATFDRIGCSPRLLEELIGIDTDITPRNLLVYIGQIEHRALELLNVLHYIALKRSQQVGEPAPMRPDLGAYHGKSTLELEISPPVPGDRDSEVVDSDPTLDTKLFDRDELLSMAYTNIQNRLLNQQRLAKVVDPGQPAKERSPRK